MEAWEAVENREAEFQSKIGEFFFLKGNSGYRSKVFENVTFLYPQTMYKPRYTFSSLSLLSYLAYFRRPLTMTIMRLPGQGGTRLLPTLLTRSLRL